MLLDTNIIVDVLRQWPAAMRFFEALKRKPSVSVVSVQELYHGAASARDEEHIEKLLADSTILLVTVPIARSAGQHMRHYAPSHGLDDLDAIIAATADHHDLELATLNVRHFPMLRRLKRAY